MNIKEFEDVLAWVSGFLGRSCSINAIFPGIELKHEQKACLKSLAVERKDVLGILPTEFGKSLIYHLLPKVFSNYWLPKTDERKTCKVIVVSPLEIIRKQQVERLKSSGIAAATLEELNSSDNHRDKEILFGSAECWLSDLVSKISWQILQDFRLELINSWEKFDRKHKNRGRCKWNRKYTTTKNMILIGYYFSQCACHLKWAESQNQSFVSGFLLPLPFPLESLILRLWLKRLD